MFVAKYVAVNEQTNLDALKRSLLQFSLFNFFLVATLGLYIRGFSLINSATLNYKYLLHGHSHFAFGGWVMPILVWMILHYFPSISLRISFVHWRNIVILLLFSSYGMLASFPFEGYGLISIIFSTLSVGAGFYLAIVLFRASKEERQRTSVRFLRAGLLYLSLSAIGPFATGPLIAMGKQGSPIYFDAIYFYLHFQYNGWFTFCVLAVLYSMIEKISVPENGNKVFSLFNLSCLPAYFLSTLWNHPGVIFYWIGGLAACMQVISVFYLIKDYRQLTIKHYFVRYILMLTIIAFALKNVLQLLSAIPLIADLAYQTRNYIIAYLHLVLLGFVSLFAIVSVILAYKDLMNTSFKTLLIIFFIAFVLTECLLLLQASGPLFNFYMPAFPIVIFYASCLFPISILGMFWNVHHVLRVLKEQAPKVK